MAKGNTDYKLYDGVLTLDTKFWMRPMQAIDYFRNKGVKISPQKLYYWHKEGKIDAKVIKPLGDLLVVDIRTSPYGNLES